MAEEDPISVDLDRHTAATFDYFDHCSIASTKLAWDIAFGGIMVVKLN